MQIRLNLGFHGGSGGGNLNGWGIWWRKLNNAGFPVNAIMADTAGPLDEIENANLNSDNVLVYRISLRKDTNGDGILDFDPNTPNYKANPENEAERMIFTKRNMFWPQELDKSKVWLKDTNEIRTKIGSIEDAFWNNLSPGEWWGRYALHAAQFTVQRNEKIILLSPSSGDHTRDFWDQPSMVQFLAFAAENPDHVAVGLHEYSYTKANILHPFIGIQDYLNSEPEDRKIGRFELLFEVCDSYGTGWPKLYFCEWGWEYENIPDIPRALSDLDTVTQYVYGPYYNYILGFGTWYLGPGYKDIANQVNGLLLPSADKTLNKVFTVEERTPLGGGNMPCNCPALVDVKTTALWIPQYNQLTQTELNQVLDWAKNGFTKADGTKTSGGHMLCPSHIDALRIHTQGLPGSVLGIAYPDKIGTGVTLQWIQNNCPCALEDREIVFLPQTPDSNFEFTCLPIITR